MAHIYCVMGKSASGKDTIYQRLIELEELNLNKIVPYTTRPRREGEVCGESYVFCDEAEVDRLEREGRIVELREYNTVFGIWKYFTVDNGDIDYKNKDYILIGTLDTYEKIRKYFGKDAVLPIYIEVEDGERLKRAISREESQSQPKYEEMCRRFLADAKDFSEEKLKKCNVLQRFENRNLEETIEKIKAYIQGAGV